MEPFTKHLTWQADIWNLRNNSFQWRIQSVPFKGYEALKNYSQNVFDEASTEVSRIVETLAGKSIKELVLPLSNTNVQAILYSYM